MVRFYLVSALAAAAAITTTSCTTLPNVEPFVALTTSIHGSMERTGDLIEEELHRYPNGDDYVTTFNDAWATRESAAAAVLEYSLALRAVVDAGGSGSQAVGNVTAAAEKMVGTLNLSIPGQVLSVATDAGRLVYEQIANAKAHGELKDALTELQPAIATTAKVFAEDLSDVGDILALTGEMRFLELDTEFQHQLSFRNKLLASQSELYEISELTTDQRAHLVEITTLVQGTEVWFRDYTQRKEAVRSRLASGREIIETTATAVGDWARAHEALVAAVSTEQERLNIPELITSARDLEQLIGRFNANG